MSVAVVHSCSVKARAHKGPVKVVYLLGADDYNEADVPADAFVIYQVRTVPYYAPGAGDAQHQYLNLPLPPVSFYGWILIACVYT